jgi:hypothetical protein
MKSWLLPQPQAAHPRFAEYLQQVYQTRSGQRTKDSRSQSSAANITAIMAPGFDQLSDHDYEDEVDNIDFSDLKERYDVRMEEGLDTFVVRRSRRSFPETC